MKKFFLLLLFISCNNQSDENDEQILNQETVEVYLLNTLNDSRGYCIDMKGYKTCLLYTSPSPRDVSLSRMPSSA